MRGAGQAPRSDVALVLLTSGSTGRSKKVPLTHRNICVSTRDICRTLALGPADRCLCMWEQFHVGGLVDLLLVPLASGGTVICAGSFDAARFYELLEAKQPTWFQGVPTTLNELSVHAKKSLARLREDRPDLFLRRYTDDLGNAQPGYNLTYLDEAQRERLALSIAVRATAVDDEANADGRLATLLGIANL